jgi:hypothetical protein
MLPEVFNPHTQIKQPKKKNNEINENEECLKSNVSHTQEETHKKK